MINFCLGSFMRGLFLEYELKLAKQTAAVAPGQIVGVAQHSRIKDNIALVMRDCIAALLIEEASHTCVKIEQCSVIAIIHIETS